jgi:hypothetical protein
MSETRLLALLEYKLPDQEALLVQEKDQQCHLVPLEHLPTTDKVALLKADKMLDLSIKAETLLTANVIFPTTCSDNHCCRIS